MRPGSIDPTPRSYDQYLRADLATRLVRFYAMHDGVTHLLQQAATVPCEMVRASLHGLVGVVWPNSRVVGSTALYSGRPPRIVPKRVSNSPMVF